MARPSIAGKDKQSVQIAVRFKPETIEALRSISASENGAPLGELIRRHVETSLDREKQFASRSSATAALFEVLDSVIEKIEYTTGARWQESPFTYKMVVAAIVSALEQARPSGRDTTPPAFPKFRGMKLTKAQLNEFREHWESKWEELAQDAVKRAFSEVLAAAQNVGATQHRKALKQLAGNIARNNPMMFQRGTWDEADIVKRRARK